MFKFGKNKPCNCPACNVKAQPVSRQQLIDENLAAEIYPATTQSYSRTKAYKPYTQNNGKPFAEAAEDAIANPQGYQK